ncbi:hypothetical protein GQX74_004907, partial [Glossina fuscipes]
VPKSTVTTLSSAPSSFAPPPTATIATVTPPLSAQSHYNRSIYSKNFISHKSSSIYNNHNHNLAKHQGATSTTTTTITAPTAITTTISSISRAVPTTVAGLKSLWTPKEIGAIIISPTIELALQISEVLQVFLTPEQLKHLRQKLIVGGGSIEEDIRSV